ncbi:hypothetical protein, conserved [Plasmodium gonderi]|uniref:Uncharacterized protein n=1 Tax=Plasmodium gonderi TaxID=77519 RepID=A0A1Y1JL62_PLAGO|nr:hypothetical protein, conserved [Plasmodium gonderi]GAW83266.1 hypothetical protein, conserved [Plasmodium gonderi]
MSKLENQIKHIENNIILKEKKIEILEKEIQELKNCSKILYEKLINQQEVLLNRKKENILTEIKINDLKKEIIGLCKTIQVTNRKITCTYAELKQKKKLINENTRTMEVIHNDIIKTSNIHNEQNDTTLTILNNFFIKKNHHNNDLKILLQNKKERIKIVKNQLKEINENINTLSSNIALMDSRVATMLYTIKNYLAQLTKVNTQKNQKTNERNTIFTCLNIINQIIEKQEGKGDTNLNSLTNPNKTKARNNTKLSENKEEEKLQLGLNTQEFKELENFLL